MPIKRCSVPINSELNFLASIKAFSITLLLLGVKPMVVSSSIGSPLPISTSIASATFSLVTSCKLSTWLATPLPSFTKPYKICSVPI